MPSCETNFYPNRNSDSGDFFLTSGTLRKSDLFKRVEPELELDNLAGIHDVRSYRQIARSRYAVVSCWSWPSWAVRGGSEARCRLSAHETESEDDGQDYCQRAS
jgi:hypothetical protein